MYRYICKKAISDTKRGNDIVKSILAIQKLYKIKGGRGGKGGGRGGEWGCGGKRGTGGQPYAANLQALCQHSKRVEKGSI